MSAPGRHQRAKLAASTCAVLAAVAFAAAGSSSGATRGPDRSALAPGALAKPTAVTLVLDFIPNAVHAGIYRAIAAGYYTAENISLRVIEPTSTADTLKLIDAGKADFGLADGIDVAGEIAMGRDAQAVLALVQRPLGAPIALASEHLRSPCQLVGRTVGITGVPSDLAALRTVVAHAGCDPSKVHVVVIGFNGVADLEAGKIAAFTGYWPDDGVALQVSGHPITVFKLDQNGGPAYPGLVAFTTRSLIASDPPLVRAFDAATVRGYEDTIRDPARSLGDLLRANPALERGVQQASLNAYLPLFTDRGAVPFGTLQDSRIRALSSWLLANRLIGRTISPRRYATNAFLPKGQ